MAPRSRVQKVTKKQGGGIASDISQTPPSAAMRAVPGILRSSSAAPSAAAFSPSYSASGKNVIARRGANRFVLQSDTPAAVQTQNPLGALPPGLHHNGGVGMYDGVNANHDGARLHGGPFVQGHGHPDTSFTHAHTHAHPSAAMFDIGSSPIVNANTGLSHPIDMSAAVMLANGSHLGDLHPSLHHALSGAGGGFAHGHYDGGGSGFIIDSSDQVDSSPNQPNNDDDGEEDELPAAPLRQAHQVGSRTARDIAIQFHGENINFDSAFCRRISTLTALREPTQRRVNQILNLERRSNVEALLSQMTGDLPRHACKNCRKGHGPWTQCVVFEGQMCGSCSNCWFNASGSRCTFHENNVERLHVFGQRQGTSSFSHSSPRPGGATPPLGPAHLPLGLPTPSSLQNDMSQWGTRTAKVVAQAMTEAAGLRSRRQRLLSRVESAAEELALRIAEYEDYQRSPEGMAEEQNQQEQEGSQVQANGYSESQGAAPEAQMDDAPSQDDTVAG